MNITRYIHGNPVSIEMTQKELQEAYLEQQAIYDKQDILDVIACEKEYDEDFYGISKNEFLRLADDMATRMRQYIEKYDMSWDDARNDAITDVIEEHIRNKNNDERNCCYMQK